MMATEISIEVLDASDTSAVQSFLEIYRSSIEISEQKPAELMAASLADPRYRMLVSRNGGNVSGFAVVFMSRRAGFALLEYMAVDEGMRGHGIGEALLDAAQDCASRLASALVLEVDQPGAIVSPGSDPMRRLRFYARRGCRRVAGLDYVLPLAVNGTPPPMWLLVRGRTTFLHRGELREWLTALYVDVYGEDGDDPRIDAMLGAHETFVLVPVE